MCEKPETLAILEKFDTSERRRDYKFESRRGLLKWKQIVGLRCVSEKTEMSVRERSKKSRNSRTVGKSKHIQFFVVSQLYKEVITRGSGTPGILNN
jgi:hypothetical protein